MSKFEVRDGGLVIGKLNDKEIILSSESTEEFLGWNEGLDYSKQLIHNEYNDWKLPSIEELQFIHKNLRQINQTDEFQIDGDCYWSCDYDNVRDEPYWISLDDSVLDDEDFDEDDGGFEDTSSSDTELSVRLIRLQ